MSRAEMQALADGYQVPFANWDEIAHPSVLTLPAFLVLIERAIATGRQLTREDVEAACGPVHWDEVVG